LNHIVTIIETKQLSDGEFAILSECCSDQKSRSWGTMAAATCSDPAKLQSFVDYHHTRIANLHDLAIQSNAVLASVQGSTSTITVLDPAPAPVAPSMPDPAASSGTSPQ
jgi:hypothetical protein